MTSENKGKVKEDETVLFSDLTNEGLVMVMHKVRKRLLH